MRPNQAARFIILGKPRGQGSLTLWRGGDGKERAKHPNETVAHRNLMIGEMQKVWAGRDPLNGPIQVHVIAAFTRPRAHYISNSPQRGLKTKAPTWQTGYPDLDKILRLIGDALTIAGVITDDRQISHWDGKKAWDTKAYTEIVIREGHQP